MSFNRLAPSVSQIHRRAPFFLVRFRKILDVDSFKRVDMIERLRRGQMQQQRADRIRIRVKQIIQIRLTNAFHRLRHSRPHPGQVSIETNVPTCGEYPGFGPRILIPSTGAAPAVSGIIVAAVAVAIEVRNVLRLAIGKFFMRETWVKKELEISPVADRASISEGEPIAP
jgi:hypothetical protein